MIAPIRRWAANSAGGVTTSHARIARWSNAFSVPDTHPISINNAIMESHPVTTSRTRAPESEAPRGRLFG